MTGMEWKIQIQGKWPVIEGCLQPTINHFNNHIQKDNLLAMLGKGPLEASTFDSSLECSPVFSINSRVSIMKPNPKAINNVALELHQKCEKELEDT